MSVYECVLVYECVCIHVNELEVRLHYCVSKVDLQLIRKPLTKDEVFNNGGF